MGFKKIVATASLMALFGPFANAQSSNWEVKNDWTPSMEKKFSEFIQVMGESGCWTLDKCIKKAASNPLYAAKTPQNRTYRSDCADLPFALRAYFSWMEGLPFDYVDGVRKVDPNDPQELRYSKFGNRPTSYRKMVRGKVYNGPDEMARLVDYVSTATYRMHFDEVSDFYPAGINREDIRPGTVLYDPSGHAAIIYKIEKNGTIKMMDAHPDQSITRITFSPTFKRSRMAHGAGFKNWRPETDMRPTSQLPNFSQERFNSSYSFQGTTLDYYDYVRTIMSGGNLNFNPVEEVKAMMQELCMNTQDRAKAVADGISSGIQNKSHPDTLPSNIYGTNGEWEEYSTPSRDARLKTGFVNLLVEVKRFVGMYNEGSNRISYTPVNSRYSQNCRGNTCRLAASLLTAYEDVANSPSCQITYKNSDGRTRTLGYQDVVDRLFAMSFDPYHCAELRWGARGSELSSCRDNNNKRDWYNAEQGLRNQIDRTYDEFMGYGLGDTSRKLGVSKAPDVDVVGYLLQLL